MGLTRNSVGTDATGLSARALARDWKGGTSAQYVLGESRIEDRGEDDGVGHAARSRVSSKRSAVAQPFAMKTGHSETGMLLRKSHERTVVIGRDVASAIAACPTARMMSR